MIAGTGERIEVIGVSADAKYTELRAACQVLRRVLRECLLLVGLGLLTGSALALVPAVWSRRCSSA